MKGATDGRHEGRDRHGVSIHAPVKGATAINPASRRTTGSFNPRAREGRDKASERDYLRTEQFQSTRP